MKNMKKTITTSELIYLLEKFPKNTPIYSRFFVDLKPLDNEGTDCSYYEEVPIASDCFVTLSKPERILFITKEGP